MQSLQRSKYLETTIQTATPGQLLIMLYDGAIRFCRTAIEALHEGRYVEANENLIKVQNIVSEFVITLDKNSPLANNLLALYEYYKHLLIQANMTKSAQPAEEVLGYFVEMKEMWIQAARAANAAGANANGNTTRAAQTVVG
ncbi:flagellar protein FliS [Paenibacillus phyllosphaerae]|uniref:Flagellar secretion chaperone FliS n=1 Tax=Paenibacillus phyllosphaerae TaxID=274593 RepID=A0A7W5B4G6_9BACL|nr:flagellar export chaperone FliS [Paenibacillus phyllosphaerae]MBB3114244.1 flagellar protein FliS [Paenibacillus phyllosphaerae]